MSFLSKPPLSRPHNWNIPAATVGIVVGWLMVNGFFLLKNGIIATGEAEKYIYQAHVLVQTGHFESPKFIYYSAIIVLLSACLKFHLGFGCVVAIQTGLNLAATFYFYKTLLL